MRFSLLSENCLETLGEHLGEVLINMFSSQVCGGPQHCCQGTAVTIKLSKIAQESYFSPLRPRDGNKDPIAQWLCRNLSDALNVLQHAFGRGILNPTKTAADHFSCSGEFAGTPLAPVQFLLAEHVMIQGILERLRTAILFSFESQTGEGCVQSALGMLQGALEVYSQPFREVWRREVYPKIYSKETTRSASLLVVPNTQKTTAQQQKNVEKEIVPNSDVFAAACVRLSVSLHGTFLDKSHVVSAFARTEFFGAVHLLASRILLLPLKKPVPEPVLALTSAVFCILNRFCGSLSRETFQNSLLVSGSSGTSTELFHLFVHLFELLSERIVAEKEGTVLKCVVYIVLLCGFFPTHIFSDKNLACREESHV